MPITFWILSFDRSVLTVSFERNVFLLEPDFESGGGWRGWWACWAGLGGKAGAVAGPPETGADSFDRKFCLEPDFESGPGWWGWWGWGPRWAGVDGGTVRIVGGLTCLTLKRK